MASDQVEWLLRQVEAWNAGDLEGFLDALGPDIEFTPDPSFPDTATYRGDEVRRWFVDWAGVWEEARFEVLWTEQLERILIVGSRWHLVAKESRDEIPIRDFTLVIEFDSGNDRARGMWAFFERDRAREKAAELTG